jgi:tRNA (guanine26-N2/guanine27-N2)-dimethyltransferase
MASILKISPPSINFICEKLREKGYYAVRTHFSPTGFKTNALKNEIEAIFINRNRYV